MEIKKHNINYIWEPLNNTINNIKLKPTRFSKKKTKTK